MAYSLLRLAVAKDSVTKVGAIDLNRRGGSMNRRYLYTIPSRKSSCFRLTILHESVSRVVHVARCPREMMINSRQRILIETFLS